MHKPRVAVPVRGATRRRDLSEVGARCRDGDESAAWAVQRLIADCRGSAPSATSRRGCMWCCPARPTAECSAGTALTGSQVRLDAVVSRWHAESSWAERVSLAHALIGWTRGPGDGHNDAIRHRRRRGESTPTRPTRWQRCCSPLRYRIQGAAGELALKADFTGGLGEVDLDMAEWPPRRARSCRPRQLPTRRLWRRALLRAAVTAARIQTGTASTWGDLEH